MYSEATTQQQPPLAMFGGAPVRQTVLPYGRQWLDDADIEAVVRALKGDYLTTGPLISQFEEKVANYVGAKYAVAFANGTAALHAACFAAGVAEGDEVITSPITFVASANCVLYVGGKPVFADIDPRTYNIDPAAIETCITPKTKAIIPVDYTGQPAELETIMGIAERNGLVVIEDAAHALGAAYQGKKVGSISHLTMFSFHPVKPVTTGEGGVVTTNDETYYQRLIQFRSHGITRKREELQQEHGPWYYEMQFLGYNYRMTDIQAALGISQLDKLDHFIYRRRQIAERYNKAFANLSCVQIPYQMPHVESGWHLYVLRLKPDRLTAGRKEIFEALQAENIGVNVHYIPVYYHPYYQQLGYRKGICPEAERLYEEIITLPLFPAMSDQDVQDVIDAVLKVVTYFRAV